MISVDCVRFRHRREALRPGPGGAIAGGVITGGVITSTANGAQKVAVAAGFTMIAWPTKIVKAKVVILGVDNASANQ